MFAVNFLLIVLVIDKVRSISPFHHPNLSAVVSSYCVKKIFGKSSRTQRMIQNYPEIFSSTLKLLLTVRKILAVVVIIT